MFRFEMRYKVRYKLPLLQLHFKDCNGNITGIEVYTRRRPRNQIITKQKKTTPLTER